MEKSLENKTGVGLTPQEIKISNHVLINLRQDINLFGKSVQDLYKEVRKVKEVQDVNLKNINTLKKIQQILTTSIKDFNANEVIKEVNNQLVFLKEEALVTRSSIDALEKNALSVLQAKRSTLSEEYKEELKQEIIESIAEGL